MKEIYVHVYTSFLRISQTTRDLAECSGHRACDLPIKECTSPSLNTRQKRGCAAKLTEARRCYLDEKEQSSQCPLVTFMEKCFGRRMKQKSPCVESFETKCSFANIRVTKVVRLSMQAVEEIILKNPDIFIVYLKRDPRGIWLSRKRTSARDHPIRSLCEQMFDDNKLYIELRIKYPGVFFKIKYEDFAENPIEHASNVYSHIGETLADDLQNYIKSITQNTDTIEEDAQGVQRVDSNQTAHAWMTKLDKKTIKQMTRDCHAYLDIVKKL